LKARASLGLLEKVKATCAKDASIVVAEDQVQESQGFSESYLEYLGLDRQDLKNLEKVGLAKRGYARGTTQNGGHQVRWVLIARE
jgi:hypothetical protein